MHKEQEIYLIIYVKNVKLIDLNEKALDEISRQIVEHFEIKNLSYTKHYLDMRVNRIRPDVLFDSVKRLTYVNCLNTTAWRTAAQLRDSWSRGFWTSRWRILKIENSSVTGNINSVWVACSFYRATPDLTSLSSLRISLAETQSRWSGIERCSNIY